MLKLFVFCLIFITTNASSNIKHLKRFVPDHEYVYSITISTISGMVSMDHKSEFYLTADANIIFENYIRASLRLTNISINNNIPIDEQKKEKLELPIKFYYINGIVTKFYAKEDDSTYSKNIKRGVLNLLQININDVVNEDNTSFITRTPELTVEGDCSLNYMVNFLERPSFNVTKTVDFSTCDKMEYSSITTTGKLENPPKINRSSIYRYMLTGTVENYRINYAEVKSKYSVIDEVDFPQSLITETFAALTFISSKRKNYKSIGDMAYHREHLRFSYEDLKDENEFYTLGDYKFFQSNSPFSHVLNKAKMAVDAIENMNTWNSTSNFSPTSSIYELVNLLRQCDRNDYEDIWRQTNDNETFIDLLSIAGTKNAVTFMFDKAKAGFLSVSKTNQILLQLSHNSLSSWKYLEETRLFCNSKVARENTFIFQQCWLTLGTLTNKYWQKNDIRSYNIRKVYNNIFINQYKNSITVEDKILSLKAMKNAAIDFSLLTFKQVMTNDSENLIVRLQAIECFERYSPSLFFKINSILLPIFSNESLPEELRLSAFSILLWKFPQPELFEQIKKTFLYQNNDNICTYVYTSLISFSKNQKHSEFEKEINTIFDMLDVRTEDLQLSRFHHSPLFSDELYMKFESIYQKKGVFPSKLLLSSTAGKQEIDVTFKQMGFDKILGNLYPSYKHLLPPDETNDFIALLSFRLNGMETMAFVGNPFDLQKLLTLPLKNISYKFMFSLSQNVVYIPTSAGFSIQFSNYIFFTADLHGELNQTEFNHKNAKLYVQLKPTIQISKITELETMTSFSNPGVISNQQLNFDGTYKAEIFLPSNAERATKILISLPEEQNTKLVEYSYFPATFIHSYNNTKNIYDNPMHKCDGKNVIHIAVSKKVNEYVFIGHNNTTAIPIEMIRNIFDSLKDQNPHHIEISINAEFFKDEYEYPKIVIGPLRKYYHKLTTQFKLISNSMDKRSKEYSLKYVCDAELETCKYITMIRIVNGRLAKMGELPFVAHLLSKELCLVSGCGSSIVGDRWLISARHCAMQCLKQNATIQLYVLTGDIGPFDGATYNISKYFYPQTEQIYEIFGADGWDIVLMQTQKRMIFDNFTKPIKLASNKTLERYPVFVNVSGFGWTNVGKRMRQFPAKLQIVNTPLRYSNACISIEKKYQDQEICLGSDDSGVGKGDSGGPVFVEYPNNNFYQIGVIDRVNNIDQINTVLKDSKFVAAFTPYYCEWIAKTTNNEVKCVETPF